MARITRRTLLAGLGALGGLPLLDAGGTAWAAGARPPKRLLVMFVPNGFRPDLWTPVDDGPDFTLPTGMTALGPVRDRTLVVSGLQNLPSITPTHLDEHTACTGSVLTCINPDGASDAPHRGTSVDQIVADAIGGGTAFPSLQVGSEPPLRCYLPGLCDGFTTISWASRTQPLAKDVHPASVHARLFGGLDQSLPPEARATRARLEKRVVDVIRGQTRAYDHALGRRDRQHLQQFLDTMADVERRLDASATAAACGDAVAMPQPDADPTGEIRAMADVLTLALQCDKTRVVTWMLGTGRSERSLSHLGFAVNHHDLSHEDAWTPAHEAIQNWYLEQYVYLLQRLAEITEPDGSTLLDNTLVLYTSGFGNGAAHDPRNMTALLGGGGGGGFASGRCVRFDGGKLADLHVAILQAFGVDQDRFGDDGTRPLLDLT